MLIKTRWVGPFLCGWSTFRLVLKSVKIIPTTVAAGCCVKQFFISTSHGILAVILCWKIVLQCSSLNLAFLSTINGGRCFFHFIIQMKILLKFYWNFILLARKMMEIDVSLFSLRIEKTTRAENHPTTISQSNPLWLECSRLLFLTRSHVNVWLLL